ncbi:MAG: hypothetical protein ACFE9S_12085 [Candidatus Hermodarchaeota archaeon]
MSELVINILYLIYLGSQLITSIFLLIRTIKLKQFNLIFLVLFFFLNPLEVIFILIVGSSAIINMLSNISLVIFTKYTFFREKKSPFLFLLISLVIIKVTDFFLKVFIPFSLPLNFILTPLEVPFFYLYLILTSLSVLLSYLWLGLASLKYYKLIKIENVEPWIKKRYLIIGYSSLIITLNSIVYLLFPTNTYDWEAIFPFTLGLLLTINTTIFSLSNLVAWIMPQKLKNYFNKDYQGIVEEDLSEDELMKTIKEQLDEEVSN